jgi:hypothetical protein
MIVEEIITQRTNSIAFSPQAIYTEWAAAASRRSQWQILWAEGCRVVSATDPHVI